ncbi:NAD(P)-dependent alcohol dehydrogenase [Roseovarius sp. A46]|uniref:NAD(P)-dependent alcohol dehydrogenase n=1 Tax=Roseovarius sp. A46 TaxID=2109331 RepID=UPI001012C0C3|nr:NAD(P)-dependent alcohol dehydrogenase [Roseovarius sp. A46]RXV58038.1 NAD(P)-dependent alcohol dehydrogenase [Roseovarius sp. A46]
MTATRTAWHIPRYGRPEILTPVTLPMPQPGPKEVLIRIHASAVTRADGMMRKGEPLFARPFLGLRRPRNGLSGTGLSGEVLAVGHEVSRFAPGDMVFGEAGMRFGANASHICLDEDGVLMPKPDSLSHEDAAVLCDGVLTSWHFLRNLGEVQSGDRVLILGGAGSLGSAAVQIAAALGAEVTATSSARNTSFVASLGATRVIDYSSEEALQAGAGFDVIFDTLGVASFSAARPALAEAGRYLCPVLTLRRLPAIMFSSLVGRKRALFAAVGLEKPPRLQAMLSEILTQIDQDRLTPVLDRIYPLSDLIEAHAYVEAGHKRGNVVVV